MILSGRSWIRSRCPLPWIRPNSMETREERLSTVFTVPLVLFFVGLFLFMSLLHGRQDLTVLTILIFIVVGGARAWAGMSLSGLKIQSRIDKEKVFPGETFTLDIRIENAKWLPVWLQVKVSADDPIFFSSEEGNANRECGLLWRQRIDFTWELTARKRGVYPIGPPRLLVGDLLGFFPREMETDSINILVYPRIVPLKPLSLPKRDLFGVPGAKSQVQDPVYILGTRDYQHSQPARYIHWKASAHHDRLQEKVFEPSEQAKVLIVFDVEQFAAARREDAFEQAIEIAASLALRFDRKGYAFGLITNGEVIGGGPTFLQVAGNPRQLPSLLEILARLKMETGRGIRDAITRDLSLPWGVSVLVLACEPNESALSVRETFVHRKIPTLLMVSRDLPASDKQGRRFIRDIHEYSDIRFEGELRE